MAQMKTMAGPQQQQGDPICQLCAIGSVHPKHVRQPVRTDYCQQDAFDSVWSACGPSAELEPESLRKQLRFVAWDPTIYFSAMSGHERSAGIVKKKVSHIVSKTCPFVTLAFDELGDYCSSDTDDRLESLGRLAASE